MTPQQMLTAVDEGFRMKRVVVILMAFAAAASTHVAARTSASCPVTLDNHASQPLGTATRNDWLQATNP